MFYDLIYCFIATFFFACVMNAPKKSIIYSAFIADIGYLIYYYLFNNNQEVLAFFLGTLAIALLGELFARIIKMPANIFIFPAVVPIVPGIGMYKTMLAFVRNDIDKALQLGVKNIINIIAMAMAIGLISLLMSYYPNVLNHKKRKRS